MIYQLRHNNVFLYERPKNINPIELYANRIPKSALTGALLRCTPTEKPNVYPENKNLTIAI